MTPLLGEMLMFGVRGFKIGRTMEASLEQYLEQAKQQSGQQQPSPEQIKAQADMQAKQAELQMEQAKMQAEQQLEAQKIQFEQWKVQLENDTKIRIAEINAQNSMKQHVLTMNKDVRDETMTYLDEAGNILPHQLIVDMVNAVNDGMSNLIKQQEQNNAEIMARQTAFVDNMTKPKRVIRGNNGRIIGVH
jgi:multidrug efflux pump subunit AcrA (membrane-fusion protein)